MYIKSVEREKRNIITREHPNVIRTNVIYKREPKIDHKMGSPRRLTKYSMKGAKGRNQQQKRDKAATSWRIKSSQLPASFRCNPASLPITFKD